MKGFYIRKIVNFYIVKDSQIAIQADGQIVLIKDCGIYGDRYSVKRQFFRNRR